MKMITPIAVTPDIIASSSVPEVSDWSSATTYALGDEVEDAGTHLRYRSVANGNVNNPPTIDTGSWWVEVGATNRMRAFDNVLGQATVGASPLTYVIDVGRRVTAIALFGVLGESVTIRLFDQNDLVTPVWETTRTLIDTSGIVDYYSFFTWEPEFQDEYIFVDINGFAAQRIEIEIAASSGNAQVSEISIGELHVLGTTLVGTSLGIEDYSSDERDAFGTVRLIERAYARTADFRVAVPVNNERLVIKRLANVRATPAVFFSDENDLDRGAVIFGIAKVTELPLSVIGSQSEFSVEVLGVT